MSHRRHHSLVNLPVVRALVSPPTLVLRFPKYHSLTQITTRPVKVQHQTQTRQNSKYFASLLLTPHPYTHMHAAVQGCNSVRRQRGAWVLGRGYFKAVPMPRREDRHKQRRQEREGQAVSTRPGQGNLSLENEVIQKAVSHKRIHF